MKPPVASRVDSRRGCLGSIGGRLFAGVGLGWFGVCGVIGWLELVWSDWLNFVIG